MQFEETIPTVVMLYFGQIWTSALKIWLSAGFASR